jgi:hypothetical protein
MSLQEAVEELRDDERSFWQDSRELQGLSIFWKQIKQSSKWLREIKEGTIWKV